MMQTSSCSPKRFFVMTMRRDFLRDDLSILVPDDFLDPGTAVTNQMED
jgi:hypothetical protein